MNWFQRSKVGKGLLALENALVRSRFFQWFLTKTRFGAYMGRSKFGAWIGRIGLAGFLFYLLKGLFWVALGIFGVGPIAGC